MPSVAAASNPRATNASLSSVGNVPLHLEGKVRQSDTAQMHMPSPDSGLKAVTKPQIHDAFGKLPLYFVANQGHLDNRVAYYVQGRDTTVYFTAQGLTIAQTGRAAGSSGSEARRHGALSRLAGLRTVADTRDAPERWAVKLDFIGANPEVRPEGQDTTAAVISYFKGPSERWTTGLKTYAGLVYRDLWPGIDLVFSGTVNRLKYTFVVHPGADPARIKLAYRGATAVALSSAGELDVATPVGGFRDERPYAYQDVDGRRVEVAAAYQLTDDTHPGVHGYGFSLGAYDRSKLLVLDPAILVYAGYIGGSGDDQGHAIAVDSAGNAYVSGRSGSSSATFPASAGSDLTFKGNLDAFVAKVKADGTGLVYVGFIGGSGDDVGIGIAVDSAGNAYVIGQTNSSESSFPVTGGPGLTFKGVYDAFVAKVNAAGTALVYAGYISGTANESGLGIAVDSAANAYVTGFTDFPVTVGPPFNKGAPGGPGDAFLAKVNADGKGLAYARYIGGSADDNGHGVAVDAAGNAYVTGATGSADFPVMVGPDLSFNGAIDAWVAKVSAAGTDLVYAGYIGGAANDGGLGIAVDSAGNAYVTGHTFSSETTLPVPFPVKGGPDLTFNGGLDDAFVAKVNPEGTGLVYAGYIGGAGRDAGVAIAVDGAGNAYVTGHTNSSEATFPVIGDLGLTFNGGAFDAFVAKVNAAGTALVYSGYIGGAGEDRGEGIAVDSVGSAYVTGFSNSSESTFPVIGGPGVTFKGGSFDAFVAKISPGVGANIFFIRPQVDNSTCDGGVCQPATIQRFGFGPVVTGGNPSGLAFDAAGNLPAPSEASILDHGEMNQSPSAIRPSECPRSAE